MAKTNRKFADGTCDGCHTDWVWNAGKERVQAAETEVYKADFSDTRTDAWNANWSVSSDNTTFGYNHFVKS